MTAHYRWNDAQGYSKPPRPAVDIAETVSVRATLSRPGYGLFTSEPAAAGHLNEGPYRRLFKRVLDVFLVITSLPVTIPMILVFALGNIVTGNAPFYSQPRLGRNGKVFRMWKLRTMVADADAALVDILAKDAALRFEWETTQKLRDDPRITAMGRFLRMSSMDELPQLFNVLKGDMSLVGPRPMMPSQRALYPGDAYFRLRPGLTGPWQVQERNGCCFASRARYDAEYEAEVTLASDIRLIARTFFAVVRGTGV